MITPTRIVAVGLAGALLATTLTGPVTAGPVTAVPPSATAAAGRVAAPERTSLLEARRVDRVPAPRLDWYPCFDGAECATARLPLDYDQPRGATTELALLRIKAKDRAHRIGSLFVNPGGPGGSATQFASFAPFFFSQQVLDRFDIVGVDPRGIGFSDNVRCFRSAKEQTAAYTGLDVAFPVTKAEERAFVASSRAIGRGCSTTGRTLAAAMSTAEVARDMDVLRRSVGDRKLNYLGFSYGSVLGQYYANMFPDRFRSLAIDGVVDPTQWVGTGAETATFDRIRSPDASTRALREILARCDRAGTTRCALAAGGAARRFETVARRLRAAPVVIKDPDLGDITISYATFVATVRVLLYLPDGFLSVVDIVTEMEAATAPTGSAAARAAARKRAAATVRQTRAEQSTLGFPYDNSLEALAGVECTDTRNPRDAGLFPALAAASDRRAAYFGRPWTWISAWCARNTWTVQDEDAYRGPFTRRTAAPVLVVGNLWDPATNYSGAVAADRLLPNSALLSSDSWGHTAYGTSACATSTIDTYLLSGKAPARTVRCVGDVQPFTAIPPTARTTRADASDRAAQSRSSSTPRQLPPVVAPHVPTLTH